MKIALAKSYNLAAVHLLEQVGIQSGAQMVRRFGIYEPDGPESAVGLGSERGVAARDDVGVLRPSRIREFE